jgi:hypothetical protein
MLHTHLFIIHVDSKSIITYARFISATQRKMNNQDHWPASYSNQYMDIYPQKF